MANLAVHETLEHEPDSSMDASSAVSAWLRAQEQKDLLRFVTIGSVDDGKSTLIGRLLHDAHGLYQDQLDAVRQASARGATRSAGSSSEIDFSLFTDGLLAEREQGITIDVAYRYFATARRKFIIADTPGHLQYTRNMATGASTADVAVILVDARLGVLAQTRRHAHIAALLGIPEVIACVNKMDLVKFDRDAFEVIAADLAAMAKKLAIGKLHAIPVSALAGDNVVTTTGRLPWWTGGTFLELLEGIQPSAGPPAEEPFRLPIQIVLRPGLEYRGFAGRILSGSIGPGSTVVALPSGKRTRVVGVDVGGSAVPLAAAPMSVSLRLMDEIDLSRGDMLARPEDAPHVASDLDADLVWMCERPLDASKTYLLKHTTRYVRASLEVVHGTDAATLEPIPATGLSLNDVGRVRVRCRAPLYFDPYTVNRATGAFIVVDSVTNDTVAAGMLVGASDGAGQAIDALRTLGQKGPVGAAERRARLGQAGGLLRVIAPTMGAARELAFSLERLLFDRGRIATVVEVLENAHACVRAGLFALVPAVGSEVAIEVSSDTIQAEPDAPARSVLERAIGTLESGGHFEP